MTIPSMYDSIDAHRLLIQASSGRMTFDIGARQRIYSEGEFADVIFFVQQGALELSREIEGAETIIGLAKEGQFFGGACLHDGIRTASATAMIDSRITSITKDALLAAISERPTFAKMFQDHLWQNGLSRKNMPAGAGELWAA